MPKVVHFHHPKSSYHACGMGDARKVIMTDDLSKVTCKRCKNTVAGAIGRPKGYTPSGNPPMIKFNTSIFLPQEVLDWLESKPNKAETIRNALIRQMNNE